MTRYHYSALLYYLGTTIYKKKTYLQTLLPEFCLHTYMHAYDEGSGFKIQV